MTNIHESHKTCPQCGKQFTPCYSYQKFCSRKCGSAFHSKKRYEKVKKNRPLETDQFFGERRTPHTCMDCGAYVKPPYKLCDKCRNAFIIGSLNSMLLNTKGSDR